jgi:microcystin-dependent protein
LFALLGNQFGGDGKTTFALPKMAAPGTGLHYVICVNGIFPSRS